MTPPPIQTPTNKTSKFKPAKIQTESQGCQTVKKKANKVLYQVRRDSVGSNYSYNSNYNIKNAMSDEVLNSLEAELFS